TSGKRWYLADRGDEHDSAEFKSSGVEKHKSLEHCASFGESDQVDPRRDQRLFALRIAKGKHWKLSRQLSALSFQQNILIVDSIRKWDCVCIADGRTLIADSFVRRAIMAEKKDITVRATQREGRGKNDARRARREGQVPVTIYGGGAEAVAALVPL